MDIENALYKNQGIHTIVGIFSVIDDELKILLIKRKNEPFKNKWVMVGGAIYNNETLEEGTEREIFEKTGLLNIHYELFNIFSDPKRSPVMRMLAIGYVAVVSAKKLNPLKQTLKTSDCAWFSLDELPEMGYDHEEIIQNAVGYIREKIYSKNILKNLFDDYFTLPELIKVYESVLGKKVDRRNFRKFILRKGFIKESEKLDYSNKKRPAKMYTFK